MILAGSSVGRIEWGNHTPQPILLPSGFPLRYRLIKPDWAKLPEDQGGIPGPNSIDGDDFTDEELQEYNAQGYGIYYFPNYNSQPVEENFTAGRHIDVFEYVYVDMDLKDKVYASTDEFVDTLLAFDCLPNKILRSGNGVHAYWRVENLTREQFVSLQLRLIRQFKTDASIWTVLRCMRLEGYYNTKKRDDFKLVEAETVMDGAYTYQEMIRHLPVLTDEDETKMTNHLRKIDGLEPVMNLDDVDLEEIPARFVKLMDRNKKVLGLFTDESHGERSERDYELACILFEEDFTKQEALAVISNTPKALSLGSNRLSYVLHTVDKIYKSKAQFVVPSAAQRMKENKTDIRKGRQINGPVYFDRTYKKWRTQQCFGLVGGSGIGKSTVTLDIFRAILENNPDSDDICVYFNLEMTDWEVLEKWGALTNNDPKMAERLFVVSNEDDEGNSRNINLQQISWFCRDIQKSTGRKIVSIAIDHIGVINPTIDIRKKPDFGLIGDVEGAFENFRNIGLRKMPQLLKQLAKELDVFLIIQSQTTKAKGMDGDTPLGIDAAYGAAQFEQYMDYVMTIWQPLRRVHAKTPMRILGWKYCKIRSKHKLDEVEVYKDMMLTVDIDTGTMQPLTNDEEMEFDALNKEATILRKRTEKKDEIQYTNSAGLKKLKSLLSVIKN